MATPFTKLNTQELVEILTLIFLYVLDKLLGQRFRIYFILLLPFYIFNRWYRSTKKKKHFPFYQNYNMVSTTLIYVNELCTIVNTFDTIN